MKARPILFSAEMILALLAGRKGQTRRIAKAIPSDATLATAADWNASRADPRMRPFEEWGPKRGCFVVRDAEGLIAAYPCPYGVPGDLLWVRETHAIVGTVDPGWVLYRASGYENECRRHRFDSPPPESEITWKPSIHMPRWASRLTLRITNIRLERLHQISEADARAEGVLYVPGHGDITPFELRSDPGYSNYLNCRMGFEALWERVNGPDSWARNDWVWVVGFDVIRANVDQVLKREAA